MVCLLDWNDKAVFNKKTIINSIAHSLSEGDEENVALKWFVLNDENEKKASFYLTPKHKAVSFTNQVFFKSGNEGLFEMTVKRELLPNKWLGELNVESGGVVKKIPVTFEKKPAFDSLGSE